MRKYPLVLMLGFLSLGILFTSCSKDDDDDSTPVVTDVRDQAVGDYDGKIYFFALSNTSVADSSFEQNFTIKKNSDNPLSIDFVIDGNTEIIGTKIAEASNGFSFDVEDQDFTMNGETVTVTGIDLFQLGGTKYHGAFEAASKEIGVAFEFSGTNFVGIIMFGGTKK